MPKRVVGILVIAVLAAVTGAAGSQQQGHASTKSAQPAQPQTASAPVSATNAKSTTISRDVCAKHPNLKQCS
jgi:hypothetical protein